VLFPCSGAVFWPFHGAYKPYDARQNSLLDRLEGWGLVVRFLPLFMVSCLLTANGNVARILSSYYARPMQLYVSSNHKRECASVYDRQTALLLDGHQLMLAKTTAFITDPVWLEAVEKNGADVGSLFRYFSELPTFTLCTSGRGPDFFWRQYQLRASGLTCEINETFPLNVLEEDAHSVFSERSCSTEHGGF
jgi:hypothetical protein